MGRKRKHRRATRERDRLRNIGPDPSGNYTVNPYSARGHLVEVAPKELRSNPNSDQFPKRIATQRILDRYLAHGHITAEEWRAGNALWEFHVDMGRIAKTTSGFDPVVVQSSPSIDARLAKYLDAALAYDRLMRAVPYHLRGLVRAVVIEEMSASDWARNLGIGDRDSKAYGLSRLRSGLQALSHATAY